MTTEFQALCNSIGNEVARLLPEFLQVQEDFNIARGNCALAIMNAAGESYGRLFGDNPPRQRESAMVVWKKANQVWLTGFATGTFERLAYAGQIDEEKYGLARPDYIGWLGGLEARTASGDRLVVAFSGVRGEQDQGILRRAAENLKTFSIVDC